MLEDFILICKVWEPIDRHHILTHRYVSWDPIQKGNKGPYENSSAYHGKRWFGGDYQMIVGPRCIFSCRAYYLIQRRVALRISSCRLFEAFGAVVEKPMNDLAQLTFYCWPRFYSTMLTIDTDTLYHCFLSRPTRWDNSLTNKKRDRIGRSFKPNTFQHWEFFSTILISSNTNIFQEPEYNQVLWWCALVQLGIHVQDGHRQQLWCGARIMLSSRAKKALRKSGLKSKAREIFKIKWRGMTLATTEDVRYIQRCQSTARAVGVVAVAKAGECGWHAWNSVRSWWACDVAIKWALRIFS